MENPGAAVQNALGVAAPAQGPGNAAPAQGPGNAALTEAEEDKLFWYKFVINGCSAALTSWNTSSVSSIPSGAIGAVMFYSILFYTMFSAVSIAALHRYGERRTWLPIMSYLTLAHLEYFVALICFEAHRLGGAKMETSFAIFASLFTLVAVAWYVWPKGAEALAPGHDNAPLTDHEEDRLFWYTLLIDGCSVTLTGWNAASVKALPSGVLGAVTVYNCFTYGMFSAVSAAALHRYGNRRGWLRIMSYLALAHLEYFVLLICFEGHRLGGTKMETSVAIYASLGTLAAVAWRVLLKCIDAPGPGHDNAPLNESEEGKLFWYALIIDGCSASLTSWNATWIKSLKSLPSSALGAAMVYNCFIYGMFSAVSVAALHRYGKRRGWLRIMSYLALAHLEYFAFLICFEVHRLREPELETSIAIYASLCSLAAVAWSVFVSHEWWAKRFGGHTD